MIQIRKAGLIIVVFIVFLLFSINLAFSYELKFASKELEKLYFSAEGSVIFLEDKNGVITSVTVIKSSTTLKGIVIFDSRKGIYYIAKDQKIRIKARDNFKVDKIEVSIDGEGQKEYKGARSEYFLVGEEGEHTVSFKATDDSGNMESEKSVKIYVDASGPEIKFEYDKKTKTVLANCTDKGVGLRKVVYKVKDSKEWTNYFDGIPTAGLKNTDIIHVTATDLVGNTTISTTTLDDLIGSVEVVKAEDKEAPVSTLEHTGKVITK